MKVGIIGAGASGMMAAVTAAEYHAEVTLFEKNDRVGKKILATGNGKCNLGNLDFSMEKYYCDDKEKLEKIFEQWIKSYYLAYSRETLNSLCILAVSSSGKSLLFVIAISFDSSTMS